MRSQIHESGPPLKAVVVGCGDVSGVHLESIQALSASGHAQLVAVCDVDAAIAARVGRAHGVEAFVDAGSMLRSTDVDVVHVCTPHDQHVPVVLASLEAGCHVLCEKPIAHSLAQAQLMVDAAYAHPELKVGICLQNRYNTTSQAAKALLSSGELGAVIGASATVIWHRTPEYYRSKPWRGQMKRSGGGVLINQAIHTIDLIQWLLGDVVHVAGQVSRVFGATVGFEAVDVEDTAHLVLDHVAGSRTVLFATVAGPADFPVALEIVAEGAILHIRDDLTITRRDGSVEIVSEVRGASVGRSYWGVSHLSLIRDFYRQVHDAGPFWIDPAEAMASQRVLSQVL